MRNRFVAIACILTMVPWVGGCGVMFGGTRQVVEATSSPTGAAITTKPETVEYKTPASISLERKNEYVLTFTAPGYQPGSVQLKKEMRTGILIADIFLTALIGVIVDGATGAWYKLTPAAANVTLTKTTASVVGPETIQVGVSVKDKDEKSAKVAVEVSSTAPISIDVATK